MGATARMLESPDGESQVVATSGSDSRLEGLVRQHFAFVWRSLRRFGLAPQDADDGAQAVFIILARHLPRVGQGQERSFLFSVALRVAANARRTAHRVHELPSVLLESLSVDWNTPELLLERRQARALLDDLLDELPLEQRAVFVLAEVEELSKREVALILEIPEGTVASRLRRAKVHLERRLEALGHRQQAGGNR